MKIPRITSFRTVIPTLSIFSLLLLVSACATEPRKNFLNMTEEELYIYNMDRPLMDKVYCFEERQTSTFIRRRQCMTVENYVYRLERAALALDVLQPSTGISAFGPIRD